MHNWKPCIVKLRKTDLWLLNSDEDLKPKTYDLTDCVVEALPDKKFKRPFCFQITFPKLHRQMVFVAQNVMDREDWISAIRHRSEV